MPRKPQINLAGIPQYVTSAVRIESLVLMLKKIIVPIIDVPIFAKNIDY